MGVNREMPFERLRVWKDALRFTLHIHRVTRSFPAEEKYILVSQLKRAADAVCLNIAEGATAGSRIEFRRYLEIARKSGMEVLAGAYITKERSLLNDAELNEIKLAVNPLVGRLVNLIKYLNREIDTGNTVVREVDVQCVVDIDDDDADLISCMNEFLD